MTDPDSVRFLIQETLARYHSPQAQLEQIEPVAMADDEHGWSGAEILRYRVTLQGGDSVLLLTKTMPLKERRVLNLLSHAGEPHVPYAYSPDLVTDASVLTCMQDVGHTKVGIPTEEDLTPPAAETDQAVARGLVSIHARHLGQPQALGWLPRADAAYITDFLARDVWRGNWEDACRANPAFAAEFAPYTPTLERAAEKLARTVQSLWDEGDSLTLTHGEVHGEHVMLHQGRPYFIDWGWTYHGPFYLDLPAYFTPHTVHHYHHALVERGIEISEVDFMERYHAIGRYVGFKYLCSGLWIWPPGPTAARGRRILMTIKWAIDGAWPHRAFAVPTPIWRQLLADHEQFLTAQSNP